MAHIFLAYGSEQKEGRQGGRNKEKKGRLKSWKKRRK